jgi:hypothetical protein
LDHLDLNILGKRHRDSVGIDDVGFQSLGFDPNLMPRSGRESLNLHFERRTIARTKPFAVPRDEVRSAMKVVSNDLVGLLRRSGEIALDLAMGVGWKAVQEGKRGRGIVSLLLLHATEVQGSSVQSRRRSSL